MIRLTTAGESHGKGLFAILEGVPAGLKVDISAIDGALARRQSGYGRGARQEIESDKVEILSGVRGGFTLGSPIALAVWNKDYENWRPYMDAENCENARVLTKVRPGHADLTGMVKYGHADARNILERASARETAVRVAAGELLRGLLTELGVSVTGYVAAVGSVQDQARYSFEEIQTRRSPVLGMMKADLERKACALIDACKEEGDTLGGVVELRVRGLKAGFGSCMTYREKLDARLVSALMSVQAVKGAEVGLGFSAAQKRGSEVHDEMYLEGGKIVRKTNRAGGIEGGMSNGEEIVLRAAMKPIPTLMRGLNTVDTADMVPAKAAAERSDVCAVLALETVLESVLCTELSSVAAERLGGERMDVLCARYEELPS